MKKIIALPFWLWVIAFEIIKFVSLLLVTPAYIILDWLEDE